MYADSKKPNLSNILKLLPVICMQQNMQMFQILNSKKYMY
jgi:hypothetical protein